jgi:uncharacterized protein YbaP (TraB family)
MKTLLAAAALAAANTQGAPAQAPALPDADPAIWVVADEDTTIYLFGTFHVLDGKADWFNEEVKTAFDRSKEIVLEAKLPDDPASIAPLIQKFALDPSGKPLSEKLSPEARKTLHALLAKAGAPANAFDKFKPGFASLSLAMIPYQAAGMSPDKGTEKTLTDAAKAAGKPIDELEGFENQLKMIDSIPERAHLRSMEQFLAKLDEAPALVSKMVTYWNAGNAEGFAQLLNEMQADSPESYKVMMSDRNAAWADWVDKRLDRPGTVFVAVGTGHLAGKDSVQSYLAKRKIASRRIG